MKIAFGIVIVVLFILGSISFIFASIILWATQYSILHIKQEERERAYILITVGLLCLAAIVFAYPTLVRLK